MRTNLVKYFATIAGAGALLLSSCDDEGYDNSPKEALELSRTSITVGRDAEKVHIGVRTRKASWTMTGCEEWCLADPAGGDTGIAQVTVDFLANDTGNSRTATFVFSSAGIEKEIVVEQLNQKVANPNNDPEYPVNKDIHDNILNEWYLWNAETKTATADYNQGYKSFYDNYLRYLSTNDLDGNKWEETNTRYVYSYITRNKSGNSLLDPLDFGMEFVLKNYNGRFVGRILYVLEGSPAAIAGLKRGDWFHKVNDKTMGDWNYDWMLDSIVKPVAGVSKKLSLLNYQSSSGSLTDNNRSLTITPARYRRNPIVRSQVIRNYSTDVPLPSPTGYLVLQGFDPDYKSELEAVFAGFKSENVTEFILDLRYSKNGTVEIAELLANLMAPQTAAGRVFASYEFSNDKAAYNKTVNFSPLPSSLNLATLYVITTDMTAGPAELLINGFRNISDDVKLVMIGDITEGMNVGMVRQSLEQQRVGEETYDYNAYPVAFQAGSYRYGIAPNETKYEWDTSNLETLRWNDSWGWKGTAGAIEDRLLQTALNFIAGLAPLPTGSTPDNNSRQRSGFEREFTVPISMTKNTD